MEHVTEGNFLEEYLELDSNEIATLAHQPKHMLRHCRIRGDGGEKKCNELRVGLKKVFTPHTGVCYAFNMVHQNLLNTSFQIDNFGPNNGLTLIIDIEGLKCYHIILINN
jgi:hypothetical protein